MLNKTPKENAKKTKSALSKDSPGRLASFFAAIIIIIAALVVALFFLFKSSENLDLSQNINQNCTGLQLQEKCLDLEVVSDPEDTSRGLSGRNSLAENSAMLFVFGNESRQCFWMKDMLFNLDIIWLDSQKRINKIEQNVRPDTYPELFCQNDTRYVIEFNSGFVANNGLKIGSELNF